MPKFIVRVREVHVSHRKVEAETACAAFNKCVKGDDDDGVEEILCEYSHTLNSDMWDVEDVDGNIVPHR